ncbi:hypothetical protein HOY80DRAFT_892627 [Tuber brumale]|nr:hypothetical protein HOY80DRAFT_892627 [Tuber brumale]
MASGLFGTPQATRTPRAFDTPPTFDTPQTPATSEGALDMASKQSPPISFDLFASSEMFTIRAGSDLQAFCFHKELLAGLSDEMRHHVYNDMREGPANTLDLKHVPPEIIRRFMEFCYTGDYLHASGTDNLYNSPRDREATEALPLLIIHAKLYAFAEMFNIALLKELSKSKITVLTPSLRRLEGRAHGLAMISTMARVLEDIPTTTEMSDKLVGFLATSTGFLVEQIREYPESHGFLHFLTTHEKPFFRVFFRLARVRGDKAPREWGFGGDEVFLLCDLDGSSGPFFPAEVGFFF